MRFRIVFAILVCSYVGVTQSALAQRVTSSSILEHFELMEEIRIPDGRFSRVHSINQMDQVGNILINSMDMGQWLYQRRTGDIIKLDAEQCRPGHLGRLTFGSFTPDGEIYTTDYMFHFWFNKDGKCTAYVSDKVLLGSQVVPIPGRRVAFIRDHVTPIDINIMDEKGNIVRSNNIQALPNENIAFRFIGGGLIYANGYLYWANSMSPVIAMFDLSLNEVSRIKVPVESMEYSDQDITLEERNNWSIQKHIDASNRYAANSRTLSISYHNNNTMVVYTGRSEPKQYEMIWIESNSNIARRILSKDPILMPFEKAPFFYDLELGVDNYIMRIYRLK